MKKLYKFGGIAAGVVVIGIGSAFYLVSKHEQNELEKTQKEFLAYQEFVRKAGKAVDAECARRIKGDFQQFKCEMEVRDRNTYLQEFEEEGNVDQAVEEYTAQKIKEGVLVYE